MRLVWAVCYLALAALADDSASSENEVEVEISIPSLTRGPEKEVVVELSVPKFLRGSKLFGKKLKINKETNKNENKETFTPDWQDGVIQKLSSNENSAEEQDPLLIEDLTELKLIHDVEEKEESSEENKSSEKRTASKSLDVKKTNQNKERLIALKRKWLGKRTKAQDGKNINVGSDSDMIVKLLQFAESEDLADILDEVVKDIEIENTLNEQFDIATVIPLFSKSTTAFEIEIPKLNLPVNQALESLKPLKDEFKNENSKDKVTTETKRIVPSSKKVGIEIAIPKFKLRSGGSKLKTQLTDPTALKNDLIDDDNLELTIDLNNNLIREEQNDLKQIKSTVSFDVLNDKLMKKKDLVELWKENSAESKETSSVGGDIDVEINIPNLEKSDLISSQKKSKAHELSALKKKWLPKKLKLNGNLDLKEVNFDDFKDQWISIKDDLTQNTEESDEGNTKDESTKSCNVNKNSPTESSEEKEDEISVENNTPKLGKDDLIRSQKKSRAQELLALKKKWLQKKLKLNGNIDLDKVNFEELEDKWISIKDDLMQNPNESDEVKTNDEILKSCHESEDEEPPKESSEEKEDIQKGKTQKGKRVKQIPSIEFELGKINFKGLKPKLSTKKSIKQSINDEGSVGSKAEDKLDYDIQSLEDVSKKETKVPLEDQTEIDIEIDLPSIDINPFNGKHTKITRNKQNLSAVKRKLLGKRPTLDIEPDFENKINLDNSNELNLGESDSVDLEVQNKETPTDFLIDGNNTILFSTKNMGVDIEIPNVEKRDGLKLGPTKQNRPPLKELKEKWLRRKSTLGKQLDMVEGVTLEDIEERLAEINLEQLTEIEDLENLKEELSNLKEQCDNELGAEKEIDITVQIPNKSEIDGKSLLDNSKEHSSSSDDQLEVDVTFPNSQPSFDIKVDKKRWNSSNLRNIKGALLNKKPKLSAQLTVEGNNNLEDSEEKWTNNKKGLSSLIEIDIFDENKGKTDLKKEYLTGNDEVTVPSKQNLELIVPDFEKLRGVLKEEDSVELEDSDDILANGRKKGRFVRVLKQAVAKKISKGKLVLEKDYDSLKDKVKGKNL